MHTRTTSKRLRPLSYLLILSAAISAQFVFGQSRYFSNTELNQLDAVCRGDTTLTTAGKKKILLYHRAGYIPPVHFELPDSIRADSLNTAAAVLCLDSTREVIETCRFNPFFSLNRERQRYLVEVVALGDSGNTLSDQFVDGPAPGQCDELGTVDSSATAVIGEPVTVDAVTAFINANSLNWQDSDKDGLRNLEEFRIGSNPNDATSPAPSAAMRINGSGNASIFAGETSEIRIDLFPGSFLGNDAEYFFWADMPDGRYILQIPAGLTPSTELKPALEAPLVSLLNFRLLRFKDLAPGNYQFHFEARDNLGSIEQTSASLTVMDDPCREETALPFTINDSWLQSCKSVAGSNQAWLANYHTFTLARQSNLSLTLTGAGDADIILRQGSSRKGLILKRSHTVDDVRTLGMTLAAGTYTAEIMLKDTVPGLRSYTLSSSDEVIPWHFTEVSVPAGIAHTHGYLESDIDEKDPSIERILQGAGVATGDYDQDGWTDMYVTAGSAGPNLLYRNNGDGTFSNRADEADVAFTGRKDAGATFADIDGDGWPDLFLGGVNGTPPKVLHNNQNGTFSDITTESGLGNISNAYSASFADYDRDGDLDAYISHWNDSRQGNYLFQNDGTGVFTDISAAAGIPDGLMADYTPIFSDINNDGWLDLLVAADYSTSQVFMNNRDGTFALVTNNDVITDDNGMGATAGDFDNDGDIDWFVTSIFDPNGLPTDSDLTQGATGASGNRLYRNKGNGTFDDVTELSGVRFGSWGWGSCFADFNNDGWLDIFHVNGYVTGNFNTNASFLQDTSLLFINNSDGTFSGREQELGLIDSGQGRGIACFDYDLDGDVDIFVANNQQKPALWRNDGGNDMNFVHIKVGGNALNSEAIGARIYVTTGAMTQMREIYAGNNFISNNPAEAYFGIGNVDTIDKIRIIWPSGEEQSFTNVKANQMLTVFK